MNVLHRIIALVALGSGLASIACAQFDGPTPLAWRWVPSGVDEAPDGSPLVIDKTVYLASGPRIYALDVATGNEKWKFPAEGAKGMFFAQPVVSGNTLVNFTDAGWFYAADVATGKQKWTYELRSGKAAVGQPVAVGKLIVYKQGSELMALDAETGQPAWEKTMPVETGFNGPLLVHDTDVIFANNNNELYSVNAVSQKINWQRKFGLLPPNLVPMLRGDFIYLYSGQYIVAINAIRGTGKWQVNLGQNMEFGPAVSADGMMCVTDEGKLYFFDLNGKRALREVVDLGSGPVAQPSALGTKYLIPTNNGALNLVDPKTGAVVWSYVVRPIGGGAPQVKGAGPVDTGFGIVDNRVLTVPAVGAPVLSGTTALIMCEDTSVLAFDAKSGVDLTPPDVDMLWPNPGAQTPGNPPLDIVFKVNDEATGVNISTLKIDVDGTPLKYTIGRDGVAVVHITYDGDNKPLADGRRVFNITVTDWIGNVAKKSYGLAIDNSLPPLGTPANLQQGKGGRKGGKTGGFGGGGGG
ncbi:MAG: hypothetical protein QOJ65_1363 [Fimbriimonadaceae bacterium]|jgi:outer membrane protein assembly factor BamB|nr:hypothetical protein [Fimbriimonadaceae bacterium]